MAIREFRLPDPGEGLVEADIVTWRVAVGDPVKVNDILLEIETSKSLVELPSPFAGTVTALLVDEGQTADVGAPIITIDDGLAAPASTPAPQSVPSAAEPSEQPEHTGATPAGDGGAERRVPNLIGYGPRTGESRRRPRKSGAADAAPQQAHDQLAGTFATDVPVSRRTDQREPLRAPDPAAQPAGQPLPGPGPAAPEPQLTGSAVLAKPPVRKLAKDLGVDLTTVTGSGPGGVVTRDDVTAAAAPPPAPAVPPAAAPVPRLPPAGRADGRTSASRSAVSARPPPRRSSGPRTPRRTSPSG